nr:radical SAM protein [Thiomonas sp. X19]
MARRTIPIADCRHASVVPSVPKQASKPARLLADRMGRPLQDLRISVTDRCNFRCTYCMPKEVFGKEHAFLAHRDLLSFEEITRAARACMDLGARKIRLTGGEPLLSAAKQRAHRSGWAPQPKTLDHAVGRFGLAACAPHPSLCFDGLDPGRWARIAYGRARSRFAAVAWSMPIPQLSMVPWQAF